MHTCTLHSSGTLQDGSGIQFLCAHCNVQAVTKITPALVLKEERNWIVSENASAGQEGMSAGQPWLSQLQLSTLSEDFRLAGSRQKPVLAIFCEIASSKHCHLPQALTIATGDLPCQEEQSPVTHSPQFELTFHTGENTSGSGVVSLQQ